jgi:hypothetical protein
MSLLDKFSVLRLYAFPNTFDPLRSLELNDKSIVRSVGMENISSSNFSIALCDNEIVFRDFSREKVIGDTFVILLWDKSRFSRFLNPLNDFSSRVFSLLYFSERVFKVVIFINAPSSIVVISLWARERLLTLARNRRLTFLILLRSKWASIVLNL